MTPATRNILIVDDEADIRDSVADVLNEFGYEADTAGNGTEALSKIREQFYDVALLDFKMPGMDGLALYREMRRVCPETSAILVSAYTGDGVAEEAISSGIRRVISKPVDMTEIIAQVDEELDRPIALIVDDDPEFCESLGNQLVERGLRVGFASNESSATRLIESRHPHVVVLDIASGSDSDTARVFETIRTSTPNAGVILVTTPEAGPESLIEKLDSDEAAAVCYKPVEMPSLLAAIEQLV